MPAAYSADIRGRVIASVESGSSPPRVFNQKIAAVVSGGTFDTYCPMASSQMALM